MVAAGNVYAGFCWFSPGRVCPFFFLLGWSVVFLAFPASRPTCVNAARGEQNPKGEEETKAFVFEAKQSKLQVENLHKGSAFPTTEWKQS